MKKAQQEWKRQENQRTLTPAEQARKAAFEATQASLAAEGYRPHDLTIGMIYANVMTLVIGLPVVFLLGLLFFRLHGLSAMTEGGVFLSLGNLLLFLLALMALTCLHELIHGLVWGLSAKGGFRAVAFGFMAQYLTPYCACKEPLPRHAYVLGALAPTLALGVLPYFGALYLGSWPLFLLSALMILSGGGDVLIIGKLLAFRCPKDTIFLDHPYQGGLVAFIREEPPSK